MIAAVILAAGESARLGRPKQLLDYRGRSLLQHVVACAADGGCDPVLVVLGAHGGEIERALQRSKAHRVLNTAWRQGVGTSVRRGVAFVQQRWPSAQAVLVLACDQPRITPELVRRLLARFERGARLVACEYADTIGVPALFARDFFSELLALAGPRGAKAVLERNRDDLVTLSWPDGALDVDHPDDLGLLS